MHRFLYSGLLDTLVVEDTRIFHQVVHVFRAKKGFRFVFFEEKWPDIVYEVVEINKKSFRCQKKEIHSKRQFHPGLTLFQAYPNKLSTLEVILQKMTELGVQKIYFFPADRSQLRSVSDAKQKRCDLIIQEALEQSGNNILPLCFYQSYGVSQLLSEHENLHHIIGHIWGDLSIPDMTKNLSLWIWPEWWWSQEEISFFQEKNTYLWSFSQSILRLETAAVAWMGILNYLGSMK